jgi:hypothetical protein
VLPTDELILRKFGITHREVRGEGGWTLEVPLRREREPWLAAGALGILSLQRCRRARDAGNLRDELNFKGHTRSRDAVAHEEIRMFLSEFTKVTEM